MFTPINNSQSQAEQRSASQTAMHRPLVISKDITSRSTTPARSQPSDLEHPFTKQGHSSTATDEAGSMPYASAYDAATAAKTIYELEVELTQAVHQQQTCQARLKEGDPRKSQLETDHYLCWQQAAFLYREITHIQNLGHHTNPSFDPETRDTYETLLGNLDRRLRGAESRSAELHNQLTEQTQDNAEDEGQSAQVTKQAQDLRQQLRGLYQARLQTLEQELHDGLVESKE